ncbi:MAG: glycosyltransferase [Polaromonas sp.]|nr:glycosyltransferase [Polaromonas sp.]
MISFIVPAYNEEQCLAETLDALHATGLALGEAYEVLVADDGSTDQTAAIAMQKGAVLVSATHRQIAATRNSGAQVAKGDWLIFVDADTVVNVDVVRSAVQAMRGGAVGGGAGLRFDEPVPAYARLMLRVIVRVFRATGVATGCFLFCTRDAFCAVGGFDEKYFGAEEIVMSRALKRQGKFVILKQTVITSARKLRTYSTRETINMMVQMALRGTKALKQRQGMEFWYAERRADPRDG